ncbi:leucine-rich repeat protein [bacterium]|nr:leucine-rich repeat protein [bacterium]
MKRFVLLIALLLLVLVGCNNENTPTTTTNDSITTTTKEDITTTKEDITTTKNEITTTSVSQCLVSFDSDGGSKIENQYLEKGSKVIEPEPPIREGYIFDGWHIENEIFDFNKYVVSKNIIIKAKWICHVKYEIENNNNITITGTNNVSNDIVILDEYNGHPTTSIRDFAFYNCKSLESISIPGSILKIGDSAFSLCPSLNYSMYKDGKYLGNKDNPYLVLIEPLNRDITSFYINDHCKVISSTAFADYTSLTSIDIPNSVTSIGDSAFYNCRSLESVSVKDGITSVGFEVFSRCTSLNYNIYDSGKYLGNNDNPYLVLIEPLNSDVTSFSINRNCKIISRGAFLDSNRITSIIIPDGFTSICNYAFDNCQFLSSIIIPNTVTSIGDYAFNNCISLKTIIIPDSITEIGYYAFSGCSSLASISIPDSVTSIEVGAFSGCSKLTSVTIPDSITEIGYYAFSGCSSLTSIVIPNSVTSIREYAFSECSSLTSIIIPKSVTSIGYRAFYYCSSLTIYCEAESKPDGWDSSWNPNNKPVTWNYKPED